MSSAIVVGAGVFGASAADRLAGSGWDVTLVEAHAPGHVRAGSGGESRLIRCSHGPDAEHARSARRALDLWRELDPWLVVESGVAWLARREDGWEAQSERVLADLGIPTERVEAASLFPSVRDDDLAFVLFEPESGVLRARNATRKLADRAIARGARMLSGRALPDGDRVVVGDETLEADRVWACGAWMPPLFPELDLRLQISQQDVFFFGADARWATPGVPGWVDYDGSAYGVGDLDGRGVKVSPDTPGPPLDPETALRRPTEEHERAARAYVAHRFPALAGAPLVGTRTCQYEITADTRFIAAPHPEHGERVWLLGGGSGHAFKHGPAFAERVERWLDGTDPADPRLGLGDRIPDAALRTAGL